jgi:aminoglycoside phosphotransferase (APT) family kinase protein
MRVVLPVDPTHKTKAEAITMRWVRENTDIPVPEVISFDDSNNNKIGFEWILMEKMPGTPLCYQWCELSMAQKTDVVERVIDIQEQLRNASTRHNFLKIGTLTRTFEGTWRPGRIVDIAFFTSGSSGL